MKNQKTNSEKNLDALKNKVNSKKDVTKKENVLVEKSKGLDFDLDKTNLDALLNKIESKNLNSKKETQGKRELYKKSLKDFEKDTQYKSYKRKIRNQLKSFCNNIQFFFLKKDNENLKKELDLFNKFYLENYILNDFSDESLRFNNADDDTKENIKDMLTIIKAIKK